jgi:hypothetical protein
MMQRFDFWKIAPEEGKFVMAATYYKQRRIAAVFTRWILV